MQLKAILNMFISTQIPSNIKNNILKKNMEIGNEQNIIWSRLKYGGHSQHIMTSPENIDWMQVVKKEARGKHDDDLGEVQEIRTDNVITKVGLIDKTTYSIPKNIIDTFDGHVLRFRLTKEEADAKFKTKDELWL